MKRISCYLALGLLLLFSARAEPSRIEVLFIGNSYTGQVRKQVQDLFKAADIPTHFHFITPGGCTLQRHAENPKTMEAIASRAWDFVVLQEQSQIPSFPDVKTRMVPHGVKLHEAIRRTGAKTVLYLTWGRKNGDTKNRKDDTFEKMQQRLNEGYGRLSQETGATLAPVGPAWAKAKDDIDLWKKDGSHPNPAGAYLAACVFLQHLAGVELAPVTHSGGLDPRQAARLREAAVSVKHWSNR